MKKIIGIILILIATSPLFAQIQAIGAYRVASATTPFGCSISKGADIYNVATGDVYMLLKSAKSTATLSGMTLSIDYINLQLWEGHIFSNYLNQAVLTTSSPTFNGLTVNNTITSHYIIPSSNMSYDLGSPSKYFNNIFVATTNIYTLNADDAFFKSLTVNGIGILNNVITNVPTGTQPYATTSTTLNTNLNADLLDGQHGSYYSNFDNLSGKDYIGMKNSSAFTDTIAKAVYTKFTHFTSSDITMASGSMSYSAGDIIVGVSGNYEITYSFQLSNSETEPDLTFRINNGVTVLSFRRITTNAGELQNITIVTTANLTAGAAISIQYTCTFAIAEYLTLTDVNVFIEKK